MRGVATHGLTHIAVAVADPQRSAAFYRAMLGARIVYRTPDFVQLQTPGAFDVLVFERDPQRAGRAGGITHFGFRLKKAADIARATRVVRAAGGEVVEHGEFVPGEPYLFGRDPDGYTFEIWFELPTAFDPPPPLPAAGTPPAAGRAPRRAAKRRRSRR
jgi:catechol 2,3-dioxygenase-like lactoylglutathione lyase family enzyme